MKLGKCLLVIVVIAFVAAVSVGAGSEAVTVCADGTGTYKSIQEAIDSVAEGTTIRIAAGTYEENLIINRQLKIQGCGWDRVTIMPKPAEIGSPEKLYELIANEMQSAKSDEGRKLIEAELKR